MSSDEQGRAPLSAASDDRRRELPAAALRALAEAEGRRRARQAPAAPREFDGRGGLDPARYGDWEINGIACDF